MHAHPPAAIKSITLKLPSSPCSECSTITALNTSWGGKFSTFPSFSDRIKVDLPLPLGPKIPYRRPRNRRRVVCERSSKAPYASENKVSHRSSPSSLVPSENVGANCARYAAWKCPRARSEKTSPTSPLSSGSQGVKNTPSERAHLPLSDSEKAPSYTRSATSTEANSRDCCRSACAARAGAFGFCGEVITSLEGKRVKILEKVREASAAKSRGGGGVPEVDAPAFNSVACAAAAKARTLMSVSSRSAASHIVSLPQGRKHHP